MAPSRVRRGDVSGLYVMCLGVWLLGSGIYALAPGTIDVAHYLGAVMIGAGCSGPSWIWAAGRRHR